MDDSALLSFAMWSAATGALMLVTGLSYRAYTGRRSRGIAQP